MEKVHLGMPSHAQVAAGAMRGLYAYPSRVRGRKVTVREVRAPLLAHGFNLLFCGAVNAWEKGEASHFAMLHADVEPEPWWLDVLLDELETTGADVVSVVVPIKSDQGLTSTAIGHPADEWAPVRRLTMTEVFSLPETFGQGDLQAVGAPPASLLLLNTGCWVARLGPWCRDVCFTVRDRIIRNDQGELEPRVIPEDWAFSRWCQGQGLELRATRKVALEHQGPWGWGNQSAWGDWQTDQASA